MHLYDIETLAVERGFDQLSEQEKSFVLETLGSPEEYNHLHSILAAARRAMRIESNNLAPSEDLAAELRAEMQMRYSRGVVGRVPMNTNLVARLLGYRIRLWQGGLALLATVVIVVFAGRRSDLPISPPLQVVYVPQVVTLGSAVDADTEAIIRRVIDSVKDEIGNSPSVVGRKTIYTSLPSRWQNRRGGDTTGDAKVVRPHHEQQEDDRLARTSRHNTFVGLANLAQAERQRSGRNINEDSAIARFLVPAERRN